MSDLSPDTNKLLELARGAGGLTDERRLQIKAGLLSQIAASGALTSAAGAHVVLGKAAWFSSPLLKGLSALALFSAIGVGLYVGALRPTPRAVAASSDASTNTAPVVQSAPDREAPMVAAPATSPSAPGVIGSSGATPSTAEPNQPNAAPSAVAAPAPALVAPSPNIAKLTGAAGHSGPVNEPGSDDHPATPTADTLAGETSLLRDADQALRAGNAARALTLLDEHASRYPRGVLAPERNAERVLARCKLGQLDAKGAQSYLGSHANSPFAARIVDACGLGSR